jgi:hypothetical protein
LGLVWLGVSAHATEPTLPAAASGDSPGVPDAPEQVVNFSVSTYPQIFLDNPTGAVQRGLVARGPDFFLPIEFNARVASYASTVRPATTSATTVPQTWNRGMLVATSSATAPRSTSNFTTSRMPTASLPGTVWKCSPPAIRSRPNPPWLGRTPGAQQE